MREFYFYQYTMTLSVSVPLFKLTSNKGELLESTFDKYKVNYILIHILHEYLLKSVRCGFKTLNAIERV